MSDVSNVGIRPARLDEAPALNELTKRSVLHWGYEPSFLEWEPEAITVDEPFMHRAIVYVLELREDVIGYHALIANGETIILDKLFLEPAQIGCGYGRILWNHAIAVAMELGGTKLTFMADPNAAPFYRAMGARFIEEIPTSWTGWRLHSFDYALKTTSNESPGAVL